jgi:predicted acylesterase/phospholipase RssA
MTQMQTDHLRSLVLAGGGVRLAYHAGVLIALEEAGVRFSHVDGTSGGIFGTAMLASGITPRQAAARWRGLKLRGFMRMLPLKEYLSFRKLRAIGGSRGIREEIFPSLGIDVEAIRRNTFLVTTYNVCNFSSKTMETIEGSQVTLDHLIAGMSLAIFSPAVRIGASWYTDGIWIKDANLSEAVKRGAREIWLVWCIGNTRPYLNGFFNQYVHMIEISANAGLFSELAWIRDLNEARKARGEEPLQIRVIKPRFPLPLDPDFFLGRINADTLINMGYAHTKQYLRHPDPVSLTDIPSVTSMEDPGITLHFRQQFTGRLQGEGLLTVYLSLFIREREGRRERELYASVAWEGQVFLSGFNGLCWTEPDNTWAGSFQLETPAGPALLTMSIPLHSRLLFLCGLDAKTARVTLKYEGGATAHGTLYQSALLRGKNLLHMNIRGSEGIWRKLRDRNRLLDSLFSQADSSQTPSSSFL